MTERGEEDSRRPRDDQDQYRWVIENLRRSFDEFNLRTIPEFQRNMEEIRRRLEEVGAKLSEHRAVQAERDEASQERWKEFRARLDTMQGRIDVLVDQYSSLRHLAGLPANRSTFGEWDHKTITIIGGVITIILVGLYEYFVGGTSP